MRYTVVVCVDVDPDANFLALDDAEQSLGETMELALREIDDMKIESITVEKERR